MSSTEYASAHGLTDEQVEAMRAYWLALRLHEGRYLAVPKTIKPAAVAAGTDWTVTVPGGVTWVLRSAFARFSTSATVANRFVRLQAGDGNSTLWRVVPSSAHAASLPFDYSWVSGFGSEVNGSAGVGWTIPLPSMPLVGGYTIGTSTNNLDAGDQWSQMALHVVEIRERTANERQQALENLVSGAHVDLYPGLLIGL